MCFCPVQLRAAHHLNMSRCHSSLNAVSNVTESGYQDEPFLWSLDYIRTSFFELPAHETGHSPSYTVTWKFSSPPACKHKLKKRLQHERQCAQMLAVKARVQIPAHLLLKVTAEQCCRSYSFSLRGDQATFFCVG